MCNITWLFTQRARFSFGCAELEMRPHCGVSGGLEQIQVNFTANAANFADLIAILRPPLWGVCGAGGRWGRRPTSSLRRFGRRAPNPLKSPELERSPLYMCAQKTMCNCTFFVHNKKRCIVPMCCLSPLGWCLEVVRCLNTFQETSWLLPRIFDIVSYTCWTKLLLLRRCPPHLRHRTRES